MCPSRSTIIWKITNLLRMFPHSALTATDSGRPSANE
jgi:hypothetical protein